MKNIISMSTVPSWPGYLPYSPMEVPLHPHVPPISHSPGSCCPASLYLLSLCHSPAILPGVATRSSSSSSSGPGKSWLGFVGRGGILQNSAHCSSARSCLLILCPGHGQGPERSSGIKQAFPSSTLWVRVQGKYWGTLDWCLIPGPLKHSPLNVVLLL